MKVYLERLREVFKKNKITGKMVGELLGINQATVSGWFIERNRIQLDHLLKIIEHYDIDILYILYGKKTEKQNKQIADNTVIELQKTITQLIDNNTKLIENNTILTRLLEKHRLNI